MDFVVAAVAAAVAAVVVVLAKVLPPSSPEAYIPEYLHGTLDMLNDLQTILSN